MFCGKFWNIDKKMTAAISHSKVSKVNHKAALVIMSNPPLICAQSLPEYFVAPGRDKQLYMVTSQRKWSLYLRNAPSHILVRPASNTGCTHIAEKVYNTPNYDQHALPLLSTPPLTQEDGINTLYDTVIEPTKRKRGRPRIKVMNTKRMGRPPTDYNKFVKRRMEELGNESDAVTRLDRIAKEWQVFKKPKT